MKSGGWVAQRYFSGRCRQGTSVIEATVSMTDRRERSGSGNSPQFGNIVRFQTCTNRICDRNCSGYDVDSSYVNKFK
jgi:hypothetical protein